MRMGMNRGIMGMRARRRAERRRYIVRAMGVRMRMLVLVLVPVTMLVRMTVPELTVTVFVAMGVFVLMGVRMLVGVIVAMRVVRLTLVLVLVPESLAIWHG